MNWTKWSSIAEITSSIAIVLTLVYLAVQTQQNQELLRAQADQAYMEQRMALVESLYDDGDVATAFFKGQNGGELTPIEHHKLNRFYISILTAWEWEFRQYQAGLHAPPLASWQAAWNSFPDYQTTYNSAVWLPEDFREYIETNVINQ